MSSTFRKKAAIYLLMGATPPLATAPAAANEALRPRTANELRSFSEVTLDQGIAVSGVRVAYANFPAIRRDFPTLAPSTDDQIRNWLIQNTGFLSESQRRLAGIRHTPIPSIASRSTTLFRPQGWNRAALVEVHDPQTGATLGMIDIKGIGHGPATEFSVLSQLHAFGRARVDPVARNQLRTRDHSDGLMSLGEAIAETTRQMAAQILFEEKTATLETVETYAILALPVDLLKQDQHSIPAALYLRQAHFGRSKRLAVPPSIYEDFQGDRQQTVSHTTVDFGGVLIRDPRVQSHFGPLPGSQPEEAQTTQPWAWGHDVAEAYARRGDTQAIDRHLQEMLAPLSHATLRSDHRAFREALQKLPLSPADTVETRLARIQQLTRRFAESCAARLAVD